MLGAAAAPARGQPRCSPCTEIFPLHRFGSESWLCMERCLRSQLCTARVLTPLALSKLLLHRKQQPKQTTGEKKKKKTKMSKRIQKNTAKTELTLPCHQEKKKNLFIYNSFISTNTTGKINGNKHWFCSIFFVPMVLLCDGPYVAGDISCSQKSRLQHHEWRLSNSMSAGEKQG